MKGAWALDEMRAEFSSSVTEKDFRELAHRESLRVLQCSNHFREEVWKLANEVFFSTRPDVELRVYGHYASGCNLGFARLLPNVRRFAADCLLSATGVDAIAELHSLESLTIGIHDLTDFSILGRVSPKLKTLGLGATQSKKLSLAPLSRFRSLHVLYIEGHTRDIQVLSHLKELQQVTLRSVTTEDLSYLKPLRKLWSLEIKLGGIRSFAGIEENESIKYLELWQVRKLGNVDVVGSLHGMQNLSLQSLPNVNSLPELGANRVLRRIYIENLKGLRNFAKLESAPALEEFMLVDGRSQVPQQLLPVLRNHSVHKVCASFGSNVKNNAFVHLREEYKKSPFFWEPFQYR